MCNFALNRDKINWPILVIKDFWKLEYNRVHIKKMDDSTYVAFLMKYIITHKQFENIWWMFDEEKWLLTKKTYAHSCFECFKNTKRL